VRTIGEINFLTKKHLSSYNQLAQKQGLINLGDIFVSNLKKFFRQSPLLSPKKMSVVFRVMG
jgi:hypothetical protein